MNDRQDTPQLPPTNDPIVAALLEQDSFKRFLERAVTFQERYDADVNITDLYSRARCATLDIDHYAEAEFDATAPTAAHVNRKLQRREGQPSA